MGSARGGLAIDSQGNFYAGSGDYVGDGNSYVKKLDNSYNYVTGWELPYLTTNGGNVAGIAVDNNDNVWITDSMQHTVYKYTNTGSRLLTIGRSDGTAGTGNGKFNNPHSITVDKDNNIFVVDTGNNRIQKFNNAGVFQWATAGPAASAANGSFNTPSFVDC